MSYVKYTATQLGEIPLSYAHLNPDHELLYSYACSDSFSSHLSLSSLDKFLSESIFLKSKWPKKSNRLGLGNPPNTMTLRNVC